MYYKFHLDDINNYLNLIYCLFYLNTKDVTASLKVTESIFMSE